jgi:nitrogen PTS system EIIA component
VNTIAKWLRPEDIRLDVNVADKRALFDLIAQHVAREFALPAAYVAHCLLRRELAGTTAVGHGVAIPHARIEGLQDIHALYVRPQQPLAFDAPDREPVTDVLVLIVPYPASQEHLDLLANAAELFSDADLRARLRATHDVHEIARLLAS